MVGIKLLELVGATTLGENIPPGWWLESYDPEAFEGRGTAAWTADPAAAMHFVDAKAAIACWQSVPRNRPVRDDGKPNRPLTVASIALAELT